MAKRFQWHPVGSCSVKEKASRLSPFANIFRYWRMDRQLKYSIRFLSCSCGHEMMKGSLCRQLDHERLILPTFRLHVDALILEEEKASDRKVGEISFLWSSCLLREPFIISWSLCFLHCKYCFISTGNHTAILHITRSIHACSASGLLINPLRMCSRGKATTSSTSVSVPPPAWFFQDQVY